MRKGVLICMHDLFLLAMFRLLLLKMKGVLKVEHKGFAFPGGQVQTHCPAPGLELPPLKIIQPARTLWFISSRGEGKKQNGEEITDYKILESSLNCNHWSIIYLAGTQQVQEGGQFPGPLPVHPNDWQVSRISLPIIITPLPKFRQAPPRA